MTSAETQRRQLTPARIAAIAGLLVAAMVVIGLAGWIATHGRIDYSWGGRPHAIRRVTPVSLAAWLLLIGAGGLLGADRRARLFDAVSRFLQHRASILGILLAICVGATAARFNAFTAAGSDPYGYVTQSLLWRQGRLVQALPPVAIDAPVSIAAFCPLGYRPGPTPGTMVPTYAPGLPLQMALVGSWTVPILAALATWATFAIARRVMGIGAALVAAACAAASPVFLFEMVQPMSDVPATAWWLAAVALAMRPGTLAAVSAGLAAAVAMVTRPNIAPLVIPCALYLSLAPQPFLRRLVIFAVGCTPGVLVVAAVNHALYGSALTSGYGSLSGFYSTRGVLGTAWTYIRWLWDTQSVLVAVPLVLPFARAARLPASPLLLRFSWIAVLFFAVLLASYAPFLRFDHWSFLRFLLPAIPLLLIVSVGLVSGMLRGATRSRRAAVLGFIALMFPFAYVHTAAKGDAFALKAGFKQQFEISAAFAVRELPADAAFVGLSQTGSLRHYAQRLTLRYDLIEPADVEALSAHLRSRGYSPWLALDQNELAGFDARFSDTAWSRDRRAALLPLPPDGRVLFAPLR